MSDIKLRNAEREAHRTGDFSAYQTELNRMPVDYLVGMLAQNQAARTFYSKQQDLIRNALPLCHCGAPAVLETTCEAHRDCLAIYQELLPKVTALQEQLSQGTIPYPALTPTLELELTTAFQNAGRPGYPPGTGKCLFVTCKTHTGWDYDGGTYLFCDDHQHVISVLPYSHPLRTAQRPLTKGRGEEFSSRQHSHY